MRRPKETSGPAADSSGPAAEVGCPAAEVGGPAAEVGGHVGRGADGKPISPFDVKEAWEVEEEKQEKHSDGVADGDPNQGVADDGEDGDGVAAGQGVAGDHKETRRKRLANKTISTEEAKLHQIRVEKAR